MKKKYEAPMVKAVKFQAQDIITSSGVWDFEFPSFSGGSTAPGYTGGGSGSGNETPERH